MKKYNDCASVGSDYLYDENGNSITSKDQNIMTIQYNLLNLPTLIQFRNGDRIINTYDASGQKLRVDYYTIIHELAAPLTAGDVYNQPYNPAVMIYEGTYFTGNKEYEIYKTPVTANGTTTYQDVFTWKRIHTQEGYVDYHVSTVNRYNYFRKDHLGNNREVWLGNNNTTVQRTQYYPSGLPWAEGEGKGVQNKKYNGKEWIEMHGLDEYDYGARSMFPAIGRFATVDPLAEKKPWLSPYNYCSNNPVNRIDPDGRTDFVTNNQHQYVNDNKNQVVQISNENYEYLKNNNFNPSNEKYNDIVAGGTVRTDLLHTVENVLRDEKYIPYSSTGNCFTAAQKQNNVASSGPDGAIPMLKKINNTGLPTENTQQGIDYLKDELTTGNSIVVGANEGATNHKNVNILTNHFFNVVGMGIEFDGISFRNYFSYYDNAPSNAAQGTNLLENRLYFALPAVGNGTLLYDNTNLGVQGAKKYVISEIRKNKK